LPFLHQATVDSILSQLLELQQYLYLTNTYIDNSAHKILHTFEKMDAINPTFEQLPIAKNTYEQLYHGHTTILSPHLTNQ
jgi:hypothetical protein